MHILCLSSSNVYVEHTPQIFVASYALDAESRWIHRPTKATHLRFSSSVNEKKKYFYFSPANSVLHDLKVTIRR